jgi:hypothetical protein
MYLSQLPLTEQRKLLYKIASLMRKANYDNWTIEQSLIIANDSKMSDITDTIQMLEKECNQ